MIVTRSPFVLSAPAAMADLKLPRFLWQTWTRGLTAASVTVSGETSDGPRDAPLRPDTFSFWEPPAMPATWQVDFGEIKENVDGAGIVGDLGSKRCSAKLETSIDSTTWTVLGHEVLPADDAPLIFLDTARRAKYLRVSAYGAQAPRIAVIYVGTALCMPYSIYGGHSPLRLSQEVELMQTRSRSGEFLGQNIRRIGVGGSALFKYLTAAWYRQYFAPFAKSFLQYPAFFAWRPGGFPLDAAYVWSSGDKIAPVNMGKRDLMQVEVPMTGIGNE